jgi:hypothetical protein
MHVMLVYHNTFLYVLLVILFVIVNM